MRFSKSVLLSLSVLMASCVGAENPPSTEAIKKLIEPRLGVNVKVDSITETPYKGLYEVRIGTDILYTDKTATYLLNGQLFNIVTNTNLTRDRIDEITKIKFSDLPLDKAIKTVKGDGSRVIAVFEDPNCGYCKRLRQTTLKETDNVTIYTFMYNILSDDSFTKSKNIWCSADRGKAWDDWMINGKAAPAAAESCDSPNDEVLALGRKLGVSGTPAIFFADGSRIPGAIDTKALEAKLKKVTQ
ncbi:thioredoxin fold domain-containing protein [Pseudoduganella sp. FT55W]|uniref:Thiol:disulfide interchange protein n=1 Tax=Duganella rivi TaxID=2666083 RepID=A0A7X4KFB2_9BURK|nr:DsbC family protein [Duganella rivi]MYM70313.1 thioredoxin fold domain-containing protein [Duganella rivi]